MRRRKKLGEILIEAKLLTEGQLKQALVGQKKAGLRLGQYLIQKGIVREGQLIDVLSKQLKIDKYSPDKYPTDPDLIELLPLDVCQKNKVIPLRKKKNLLTVAMIDPMDINALDNIEFITSMEVEPVVCSEREMSQLIRLTYGMQSGFMERLEKADDVEMDVETVDVNHESMENVQVSSLQDQAAEPPIVRLVNSIVTQAVREGASDIHISPETHTVQLRFRIDGKLHEVPSPPKSMILPIISRIKILSNMDIAISRIPQDGRFTVKIENKEINIRVSSIPTIYPEFPEKCNDETGQLFNKNELSAISLALFLVTIYCHCNEDGRNCTWRLSCIRPIRSPGSPMRTSRSLTGIRISSSPGRNANVSGGWTTRPGRLFPPGREQYRRLMRKPNEDRCRSHGRPAASTGPPTSLIASGRIPE